MRRKVRHDFFVRGLCVVGLARKYRRTIGQIEDYLRERGKR